MLRKFTLSILKSLVSFLWILIFFMAPTCNNLWQSKHKWNKTYQTKTLFVWKKNKALLSKINTNDLGMKDVQVLSFTPIFGQNIFCMSWNTKQYLQYINSPNSKSVIYIPWIMANASCIFDVTYSSRKIRNL